MSTVQISETEFDATVTGNDIVLVDFWAAWCGPCRNFAPVFEAVSEENPEITFAKVDTDANQALASAAGITSIPTLMAFRENVLVYSQPGALPRPQLEQLVKAVKELDMEKIHASVAEAKAKEGVSSGPSADPAAV